MKISHNKSHMDIALLEEERAMLKLDRVKIDFNFESRKHWVSLTPTNEPGGKLIGHRHSDSQYRYSVVISRVNLPLFGVEVVDTAFHNGVLYGAKPMMNAPRREVNRLPRPRVESIAQMPGLEELKQAVTLINNMRRNYGEQLEMQITPDGVLRVRLLLEI